MQRLDLLDDAALADLYAYPGEPMLRSNMVMTADGAAASLTGTSVAISGIQDRRLLALLRALADVVIVAAGTIRAEGYSPLRTRPELAEMRAALGLNEHPRLVVITREPNHDPSRNPFAGAPVPPLVLCVRNNESLDGHAEVVTGPERDGVLDLGWVKQHLLDRGHTRLLTEGGPQLLAGFVASGLVDEYCLSISPNLVGGDAGTLRPLIGPELECSLELRAVATAEDFLFLRYRTSK